MPDLPPLYALPPAGYALAQYNGQLVPYDPNLATPGADLFDAQSERESLTRGDNATIAALKAQFRIIRASGAAVQNDGRDRLVGWLSDATAPARLRTMVEGLIKPYFEAGDVTSYTVTADFEGNHATAIADVVTRDGVRASLTA